MSVPVKYEIRELSKKAESQLKRTDRVIASNELIADKVSELNQAVTLGLYAINEGLREFCFVIDDGLREVYDKLDLMSHQLDSIREILEKPLDTQARELRKRGEFAYLNDWIEEAETDLLEAERKNYQDFLVHLMLGNIYFYHKTNHQKALEYYQKAAKYAAPQSKKHAGYALVCAAMVYYKDGRIADAYNSTKLALEFLPQDWNAVYHHARYSAKMGHLEEFKDGLTRCIINYPTYLLTADNDDNLLNVKSELIEISIKLRDEKKNRVEKVLKMLISAKEEAEVLGIRDFESFNNTLHKVTELYKRNSYFDLLKAEQLAISEFEENLSNWLKSKNEIIASLDTEKREIEKKEYSWPYWGIVIGILTFVSSCMYCGSTHGIWKNYSKCMNYSALLSIGIAIMGYICGKIMAFIFKDYKLKQILYYIEEERSKSLKLKSLSIRAW